MEDEALILAVLVGGKGIHDARADILATREIMNYIFSNLMK